MIMQNNYQVFTITSLSVSLWYYFCHHCCMDRNMATTSSLSTVRAESLSLYTVFTSSISWVRFILQCRVSTDIPVVPPSPEDSDQGNQCLFLFRLHSDKHASPVPHSSMMPDRIPQWKRGLWGTNLYMYGVIYLQPLCISIYFRMIN